MNKMFLFCLFSLFSLNQLNAQDTLASSLDSNKTQVSAVQTELRDSTPLLPDRILFSQALFWGKKGLMRNFKYFELTPEKRQRELKIRRNMLGIHQILGYATLGGMIAQGIVGANLYNGNTSLKSTHEALAVGINIGYYTTASMSLFAPPRMFKDKKGFSTLKAHKILGILHFYSMAATNILATQLSSNPNLRPYHRATAFTAFGAFAVSMIIIRF